MWIVYVRVYNKFTQTKTKPPPPAPLITKDHQPRIQNHRIQQMTPHAHAHREHHRPVPRRHLPPHRQHPRPIPSSRYIVPRAYHKSYDDEKRDDDGQPEATQDFRDLDEEVGALDFFLGCAPGDVVGDAVGDEGLGEVDGEAAKEEEAMYRRAQNGEGSK